MFDEKLIWLENDMNSTNKQVKKLISSQFRIEYEMARKQYKSSVAHIQIHTYLIYDS